ncbi:LCP family protein [Alkaliphilus serpentinus]|uniref:LytR family transcriptional regulator n=1 Tax=Alkaliphilus serpentinus TaxID=1482731 RepID=A0A833M7A9_9FIRM|nr:LCP family protein [Alkaliphilus serpentinus]KAB3527263.1 LytR family transcriptional regulator [Alkaliphilus serpentinus]
MNKKRNKIWMVITIILSFIVIITALYGYRLYDKYKETLRNISEMDDEESLLDENHETNSQEPFILLVYGISERINDKGHSDTMLLALVDPKEVKVQLISIPRDAYVDIPGYKMDKLNVTYPRGGSKLMIDTLENWLDIEISGFVSINFEGFINLVDLFGGIEVDVDRSMSYDDPYDGTRIRISPGKQVLDGKNALDFVRFRYSNDGRHSSDYERMDRQQQALKALANKLTIMNSLPRLFSMMDILSDHVKTSLPPQRIEEYIKTFKGIKAENIVTDSIQGEGHKVNELWYEKIPDEEVNRIRKLIEDFLSRAENIE